MKAKFLITTIGIALLSITMSFAQTGANFSNPCLGVKKGPNTLKTIKHESRVSNNRFNAHQKTFGNGNPHAYGNNSGFQTKTKGRVKKQKNKPSTKKIKTHRKKANKRHDRGNRP